MLLYNHSIITRLIKNNNSNCDMSLKIKPICYEIKRCFVKKIYLGVLCRIGSKLLLPIDLHAQVIYFQVK